MESRYLNITLIDNNGAPTTVQVMSSAPSLSDAMLYIEERITRRRSMLKRPRPFVRAFVFDTAAKTLTEYRIAGSSIFGGNVL